MRTLWRPHESRVQEVVAYLQDLVVYCHVPLTYPVL